MNVCVQCSEQHAPGVLLPGFRLGLEFLFPVTERDVPERNQAARAAAAASRPQEQQLARATDSTLARPGAGSQSWRVHAGHSRKARGQHLATLEAWARAQEPTGEDGHEGQACQP